MSPETDINLLNELIEPTAALLNHHLEVARVWYPHLEVPYDLAHDFTRDEAWSPDEYPLADGVRSALYVNLLTEDNLPYYTHTIISQAVPGHPLEDWTRRWTAEESRHATVIRDWIIATRALDPVLLEDGRMVQMSKGEVPEPDTLADMLTYTSFQELATQVAHRNTGKELGKERRGNRVMAVVAGDEGLHHEFYSGLASAGFEIDPSAMMIAAYKQVRHFDMPGTGIPDFKKHSKAIEKAKIFDVPQLVEQVFKPTLAKWNIYDLEGLTPEAEAARADLDQYITRLVALVGRLAEREARQEALATT